MKARLRFRFHVTMADSVIELRYSSIVRECLVINYVRVKQVLKTGKELLLISHPNSIVDYHKMLALLKDIILQDLE